MLTAPPPDRGYLQGWGTTTPLCTLVANSFHISHRGFPEDFPEKRPRRSAVPGRTSASPCARFPHQMGLVSMTMTSRLSSSSAKQTGGHCRRPRPKPLGWDRLGSVRLGSARPIPAPGSLHQRCSPAPIPPAAARTGDVTRSTTSSQGAAAMSTDGNGALGGVRGGRVEPRLRRPFAFQT